MNASGKPTSEKPTDSLDKTYTSEQLEELRELLVGPEQQELAAIRKRLNDPVRKAEELSQSLPDAIALGSARGDDIARALQPTIDASLRVSVTKNPKLLADAIYPALGPAIRKSISSTILGMIQSLNQALNHSFSIRGLKWRLEAMRSRKPFAEVILLNTLVYRVEQTFLIHRKTGLVLQHVETFEHAVTDPDLVSGMLSAIQDFVKDSFSRDSESGLDTLRMAGDRSVWIEQGALAVMAVVVQGTPPLELRRQYADLLEKIHLNYGSALSEFNGDVSPFVMLRPSLEDGLQARFKEPKQKTNAILWVLLLAVAGIIGFGSYGTYRRHMRWESYLQDLNAEPGIVLTSTGKANGRRFVSGMRDPLAADPVQMLHRSGVSVEAIDSRWEFFHSMNPELVMRRAHLMLKPQDGVKLKLVNETLIAEGSADHQWVAESRRIAPTIPGVSRYDDTGLLDTDLHSLEASAAQLEQTTIYFKLGTDQMLKDQEVVLQSATAAVQQIQSISSRLNLMLSVIILGHTDASGSAAFNRRLSRQRADRIMVQMIQNGIHPGFLRAVGTGAADADRPGQGDLIREVHRCATFKLFRPNPAKVSAND